MRVNLTGTEKGWRAESVGAQGSGLVSSLTKADALALIGAVVVYPAVELLTALLWLACRVRFGWTWELAAGVVLVSTPQARRCSMARAWLNCDLDVPSVMPSISEISL